MRPDLARLTEEERRAWERCEAATDDRFSDIVSEETWTPPINVPHFDYLNAIHLREVALRDVPTLLATIADLRAELYRVEGELLEAVKSGNWARAEAIDAKGRAVVAEQRVRDAKSVCNRANKMMTGEMIVYVSDIRAALEPKP